MKRVPAVARGQRWATEGRDAARSGSGEAERVVVGRTRQEGKLRLASSSLPPMRRRPFLARLCTTSPLVRRRPGALSYSRTARGTLACKSSCGARSPSQLRREARARTSRSYKLIAFVVPPPPPSRPGAWWTVATRRPGPPSRLQGGSRRPPRGRRRAQGEARSVRVALCVVGREALVVKRLVLDRLQARLLVLQKDPSGAGDPSGGQRTARARERREGGREGTHVVLLPCAQDLGYGRRDERNRRLVLDVEVLRAQTQAGQNEGTERVISACAPERLSRRGGARTTSPSRTTFSPRTRKTPRGMSANVAVGGWKMRSYDSDRTRLAGAAVTTVGLAIAGGRRGAGVSKLALRASDMTRARPVLGLQEGRTELVVGPQYADVLAAVAQEDEHLLCSGSTRCDRRPSRAAWSAVWPREELERPGRAARA